MQFGGEIKKLEIQGYHWQCTANEFNPVMQKLKKIWNISGQLSGKYLQTLERKKMSVITLIVTANIVN